MLNYIKIKFIVLKHLTIKNVQKYIDYSFQFKGVVNIEKVVTNALLSATFLQLFPLRVTQKKSIVSFLKT